MVSMSIPIKNKAVITSLINEYDTNVYYCTLRIGLSPKFKDYIYQRIIL